jgi:hypothetical protein
MAFCPDCGTDHHAGERTAADAVASEVRIAKINADRDIEVARINARLTRNELETAEVIAEIEGEAEVGAAAAEAEVVATILGSGDQEPEPVIIDAPPLPEPEPDPTDDAAPPPAENHHEPGDDKPRKHGLGMW